MQFESVFWTFSAVSCQQSWQRDDMWHAARDDIGRDSKSKDGPSIRMTYKGWEMYDMMDDRDGMDRDCKIEDG